MPRRPNSRAAVTNGAKLLPGSADGRSRFARRYRDLVEEMSADLGGSDRLSTLQAQLVRRAAALAARCEIQEAELAAGRTIDAADFVADVGLLARIARTLGLTRIAHDVNGRPSARPNLKSYLAAKAARAPLIEQAPADLAELPAEPPALTGEPETATTDVIPKPPTELTPKPPAELIPKPLPDRAEVAGEGIIASELIGEPAASSGASGSPIAAARDTARDTLAEALARRIANPLS